MEPDPIQEEARLGLLIESIRERSLSGVCHSLSSSVIGACLDSSGETFLLFYTQNCLQKDKRAGMFGDKRVKNKKRIFF